MSFKFNISEILNKFELTDREKSNLVRLFEFTNYLYDNEENLTKTFNLVKDAKSKLIERLQEMFESEFKEDAVEVKDETGEYTESISDQEGIIEDTTESKEDTTVKEDDTDKEDITEKTE